MDADLGDRAVCFSHDEGVGWITLNRPGQINAINDEVRSGVPVALQRFEDDPSIRVIVIHGAGPRGFCAGADIRESREAESPQEIRRRLKQTAWIEALDRITKPVIAAIHGYCLGGGLELALACDLRIAAPDAVFALPEVKLGLMPGGGGTQRLGRLIGLGRAMDLLLTGDQIDATEAHRLGLASRIAASADSLLIEADALAKQIAAKPPLATAYVKEAARAGADLDLRAGLDLERSLFTLLLGTDDRREAAAAFSEKRPAKFSGR